MTDIPLVSVVIATYNRANLLAASVESVLSQDYPNVELIIVDDCSVDRTPEVIANFEAEHERVHGIRLSDNSGPSAARNRGIEAARGSLVAFLDDDDLWLPGKLTAQVSTLQDNPEAALCYAKALVGTADGVPTSQAYSGSDLGHSGDNFENQLRHHAIKTPTVVVRKAVLEDVGVFDETLATGEDTDLFLRITLEHPATYVPEPVTVVREHKGRMTLTDRRSGRRARCLLTVFGRLWDHVPASQRSARGLVAAHLTAAALTLAECEKGKALDREEIREITRAHSEWFDFPEPFWPLALAYAASGSTREARAAARRAVEQSKMGRLKRAAAWALYIWPRPVIWAKRAWEKRQLAD
jgi:glycosyltransferase involved in cell wall biosynthesis